MWWLILNGVILRIRPSRSAKAYQQVWQEDGSPILSISKQQVEKIQARFSNGSGKKIICELAMRYGNPSIKHAIDRLQDQQISKLLVLPMYPQYCAATTASVFDAVSKTLQQRRWIPETRFINHYYNRPDYINALAQSVRDSWEQHGRGQKLVLSYHGIPQSYVDAGDPYYEHCRHTTELLCQALDIPQEQAIMVFQSRVGREVWLKPYCDETLKSLPSQGITDIDIISPAFSADCLETLEELEEENRDYFLEAGGKRYQYIPALNDRDDHIDCLQQLLQQHLRGW